MGYLCYTDRHTDIHTYTHTHTHNTTEPLVPEPNAFEVELATENLKGHKSSDVDQIQGERFTAGVRKFHYEIHNLITVFPCL
jgi:hypothetical protein